MSDTVRCRWVYDGLYQTRGSYGLGTEEETRAAEDEELAMLDSGNWVALGCIVETLCPTCGEWRHIDDLWGIVIDPNDEALDRFARSDMLHGVL